MTAFQYKRKVQDIDFQYSTTKPFEEPLLSPEDQARINEFLAKGNNSVERKPFKPGLLIFLLISVVTSFSLLSQVIARWAGIY